MNNCLTLEANADQTGRAFLQDVFMSLMDEGCVAIVPVEADTDPTFTTSYTIYTMRTAQVMESKYDFCGWATRNNLKCSDGRTILPNAFKDNDGRKNPRRAW